MGIRFGAAYDHCDMEALGCAISKGATRFMIKTIVFASILFLCSAESLNAQKVVYWPLEDTTAEYTDQLKSSKHIVWQQMQTIDGLKKHKLLKKDRQRLKKCGAKAKCLKRWLSQRGVLGLFYIKLVPQDEGLQLSMRFLDQEGDARVKSQNLVWNTDLDTFNYDIEVMVRRWLKPDTLRGTLKLSGLTSDAKLWLDGVSMTEGLMQAAWSRTMQAGIHTVRVERNAYVPYAKNIEINHRKTTQVEVSWRPDPLYKVEKDVSRFDTRRTEVLIGTGVAGASLLVWTGAAVNTLIVGAEMEKRAQAQLLYGETHTDLVAQGETSAWVANISLGALAGALAWNLYWGFQPSEDTP
jgi:hypothetical protein